MKDLIDPPEPVAPLRVHLVVADAARAIAFYRAAFGAEEEGRETGAGGRIAHAELWIFGNLVMLADDRPSDPAADAQGLRAPSALGATTATLHVDLATPQDLAAVLARAEGAGARITFPARPMDWGSVYARLLDPFGHAWSFAAEAP